MDKDIVLAALAEAAEQGIPAVQESIKAFQKKEITLEDIQGLKKLVKKPESYFGPDHGDAVKSE